MKYRIDAYKKGGAVKQGTKLLDNIDEAIKLAYAVANHYKCYTRGSQSLIWLSLSKLTQFILILIELHY